MKLHLIRHAQAQFPEGGLDIERFLSDKGRGQARQLADFLSSKDLPNEVWCSAAQRTKETLSFIEKEHSFPVRIELNELYLCSKDLFLKKIWGSDLQKDLLIVGHNFGVSELVNYFTGELLLMDTAEYICIDFGDLSLNESSKETGVIVDRFIP